MFNIKLIDIGGDGLVIDFNTVVETLKEAELLAGAAISNHINRVEVELRHEHDLVYDVLSDGEVIGCIMIRSL
jgi:hypothetical protein